jgi:hypothetical protein
MNWVHFRSLLIFGTTSCLETLVLHSCLKILAFPSLPVRRYPPSIHDWRQSILFASKDGLRITGSDEPLAAIERTLRIVLAITTQPFSNAHSNTRRRCPFRPVCIRHRLSVRFRIQHLPTVLVVRTALPSLSLSLTEGGAQQRRLQEDPIEAYTRDL